MANFGKGFTQAFRPQDIAQFLLSYQDRLDERRQREMELAKQRLAEQEGGRAILEARAQELETMRANNLMTPEEYNQWSALLKGQIDNPNLTIAGAQGMSNVVADTFAKKRELLQHQQEVDERLRTKLYNAFQDERGNVFGIFTKPAEDGTLQTWVSRLTDAEGKPIAIPRTNKGAEQKLEDLQKEYKNNIEKLWGYYNRPEGEYRGEFGRDYASQYFSVALAQTSILERMGSTDVIRKSDVYRNIRAELQQKAGDNKDSLTIGMVNSVVRKHTTTMKPEQISNISSVIVTDLLTDGYKLKEREF